MRKHIVPLLALFFFLLHNGLSAQHTLSGIVRQDVSGDPIGGAHIFLTQSKKGTSSDARGRFSLQNLTGDSCYLTVSHIGYRDTSFAIAYAQSLFLDVSLLPDSVEIASIVVTANRSEALPRDVPQRIDVLDEQDIRAFPANNTDDLLKQVPGLVVNRSWGIFSRNASVTMRGMPGSTRSLILLDGIPLNKTSGGTVNWHLVTPGEIERIEVVKGPGSALYGMNAMGGVINLITQQPKKRLMGSVQAGYGTYNTVKGQVNLQGNSIREQKGLFWKLGGFYRQGDGYTLEPESTRTEYSSEAYLREANASLLVGYQFKANEKLELDFRFYDDKRGSGTRVYTEDGSFESFTNYNLRAAYQGYAGKTQFHIKGFYLIEKDTRQNESVNSSGEYKLTDTETGKSDAGLWMSFNRQVHPSHNLVGGMDIKQGSLSNEEVYRTSTDRIETAGDLFFTGLFLQDEMNYFDGRLNLVAALRLDLATFYNGSLTVYDPTSKTGFPGDLDTLFQASSWSRFSPKLSAKYFFYPHLGIYASLASGFMPPRLDDLVGSRKIRRGFKIANPNLTPEVINSAEVGVDWTIWKKLVVNPTLFYSRGHDFQYLVATGDFIDSGSDDPVAVYQRQNVSKVDVSGVELGLEYILNEQLRFVGSYAYNRSEITEYTSPDGTGLEGNTLNEVPANLVFAGVYWKNRIVDCHVNYTFTDDQWFDEYNTEVIPGYSLLNLRLSREVFTNFDVILDIQDLLDEQFIDRKGYLSPGRFIMLEINYQFK